jgi:uncharacterized protein YaaW (UPF0174 family)
MARMNKMPSEKEIKNLFDLDKEFESFLKEMRKKYQLSDRDICKTLHMNVPGS